MKTYTRKPMSDETKAKIGAANRGRYIGRKLSAETRAKMSQAKKKQWEKLKQDPERVAARNKKVSDGLRGKYIGDKASQWKGGLTQGERYSRENWAWRDAVLLRDNYTCQVCDQYGGMLHVDHIKPWAEYPELRFDRTNGRTLCRACHYYLTFKKSIPVGSRWGLPRRNQRHQKTGIKDLQ